MHELICIYAQPKDTDNSGMKVWEGMGVVMRGSMGIQRGTSTIFSTIKIG